MSLSQEGHNCGVAQRAEELAAAERDLAAKEAAIAEREEEAAAATRGPRQALYLKAAKVHRAAQVAHERATALQEGHAFDHRPKAHGRGQPTYLEPSS